MSDTTQRTEADESSTDQPSRTVDAAVIGGGPAGLSAAVFCARADFETIVIEHNKSTLRKCAHLENYLGFPGGLPPDTFLDLARDHARTAGCRIESGEVTDIHRPDDAIEPQSESIDPEQPGFLIEADERYAASYLLIASWSETGFLDSLGVDTHVEAGHGDVDVIDATADGRTNVDGLYAAGRITDQHHQAIINAGHGARVARTLIEDVREYYNDWVVPEGYFEHYDREVPPGCEEISHEERKRRVEQGRKRMQSYFGRTEAVDRTEDEPEPAPDD